MRYVSQGIDLWEYLPQTHSTYLCATPVELVGIHQYLPDILLARWILLQQSII